MVSYIKNWIVKRIAVGEFSRRRDVVRFALMRTFWTTIAAVLLNFGVYQLFGRVGFLDVVVPPNPGSDTIVTAFVAGPISFLAYYFIGSAILDLAISRNAFEKLSRTDPLTGLMNRRAFVEVIAAMEEPYVLALFDIDRFKAINDTYGHGAGDHVLIEVSHMLHDAFGQEDAVARLGGEEFGVVLRQSSKEEAVEAVNLFRERMAVCAFTVDGLEIPVTISAGVSQGNGKFTYSMLLTDADKALYLAKASGRNRVVHADELAAVLPQKEGANESPPHFGDGSIVASAK
jgi:diguanylate cyclase (GGDEF)-like protein